MSVNPSSESAADSQLEPTQSDLRCADFDGPGRALLTSPPVLTNELDDVVEQLRRIRDSLAGLGDSREHVDLASVRVALAEIADDLEKRVPAEDQRLADMWLPQSRRRHNAVTGAENPIAPPIQVYGVADGTVEAEMELGISYQGPPGLVHGGISALILDHILGHANDWMNRTGMTARLTLNYRRPTPLYTPLRIKAGVTGVEGRKTFTNAAIYNGDEVCVEVEGLFVSASVPRPRSKEDIAAAGNISAAGQIDAGDVIGL